MLKRVLTVTLVAAGVLGFVSVVGNWTDALDAEFLVFGQTGGTGTGSGGGGTGQTGGTTITKIIPQVAAGSFDGGATTFSTTIQVINVGTSAVSLTVDLFNQDGTPSTIPFTTTNTTAPTFTATLSSVSIPSNDAIVIQNGSVAAGAVNWARLVTDGTVTIAALFEIKDANGVLISRVGVPSSDADITKLLIPRLRNADPAKGTSTAFAVANTGDATASVTATLYSAGQVAGTQTLTLAAKNQTAQFAKEFFSLTNEATVDTFSFMIFESTTATLAATALVFEGNNQATFPVDKLQ